MKRKIVFTFTLLVLGYMANPVFAQKATTQKAATPKAAPVNTAVAKTATYDVKKAVKCRIAETPEGCSVVFENAIVAARGGVTLEKNVLTKKEFNVLSRNNDIVEINLNNPDEIAPKKAEPSAIMTEATMEAEATMGTDKATMKNFRFSLTDANNTKRDLVFADGECDLPSDLKDGKYTLSAFWIWATPSIKAAGKCSLNFIIDIKEGSYTAITAKAVTPGKQ